MAQSESLEGVMGTKAGLIARTLGLTITVLGVIALLPGAALSKTVTQIIDSTGDGGGNPLATPQGWCTGHIPPEYVFEHPERRSP